MALSRMISRCLFSAEKFSLFRRCSTQSIFNLEDPAVHAYLKNLMLEHENLYIKPERTAQEYKRYCEIKPIVNVLQHRVTLYENIVALRELNKKQSTDIDLKKIIKEEVQIYYKRMNEIDRELQSILLEPQLIESAVLLEVTAGVCGQESILFAQELFEMYKSYAKHKDWEVCVVSIDRSDTGGIKQASMFIEGFGVFDLMKMEEGVHRVLKLPPNAKYGVVQVSTASVAVLPKPTDTEITIQDSDIVVETKYGSNDQHRYTPDSAVRIIHTPSGIVVESQEDRPQMKNKQVAIQKLRTLLLEKKQQEQAPEMKSRNSASRNGTIRTYHYPQDRVTEHRKGGGTVHYLKDFMSGNYKLEQMQQNLLREYKRQAILDEINQFAKNIQEKPVDCNTVM